MATNFLGSPIFQISPNSEKRCRNGQNRDFCSSEGHFDRKTVPQESESASIRSARRFSTNPCLRGSRDLLSKNYFRSSIVQNVQHLTPAPSDTGNLLKSTIPDFLHFLQTQVTALKHLHHLRRQPEAGPPTPPLLLRSVQHNAVQHIRTAPAQTTQRPEKHANA